MANRILLNQSGLKVSKPGINVLSASDINLNFSSDWGIMATLISGAITLAADAEQDVFYGKTFTVMPMVSAGFRRSGRNRLDGQGLGQLEFGWLEPVSPPTAQFIHITPRNNRVSFRNLTDWTYIFYYNVWSYNL